MQVGKSGQSQELGAFGSATMEEYQFVVTVSRPAQQDEKRWLLRCPKILRT